MSNKEAIKILTKIINKMPLYSIEVEAIDTAIEELKKNPHKGCLGIDCKNCIFQDK